MVPQIAALSPERWRNAVGSAGGSQPAIRPARYRLLSGPKRLARMAHQLGYELH